MPQRVAGENLFPFEEIYRSWSLSWPSLRKCLQTVQGYRTMLTGMMRRQLPKVCCVETTTNLLLPACFNYDIESHNRLLFNLSVISIYVILMYNAPFLSPKTTVCEKISSGSKGGQGATAPQKFSWFLLWPPTFLEGSRISNFEYTAF